MQDAEVQCGGWPLCNGSPPARGAAVGLVCQLAMFHASPLSGGSSATTTTALNLVGGLRYHRQLAAGTAFSKSTGTASNRF